MKILKYFGLTLLVLILIYLVLCLVVPAKSIIKRSVVIHAEKTDVWEMLVKFKHNQEWSPWLEADTTAKITISANDGEVGCTYEWAGNDKVGAGKQTRKSQKEFAEVENELHFLKPFDAIANTKFLMRDTQGASIVTWTFEGDNSFLVRGAMFLMGGPEKMIGSAFEKGLNKLKSICESGPVATTANIQVGEEEMAAKTWACVVFNTTIQEAKNMSTEIFSKNADKIVKHLTSVGGHPEGNMHTLYFTWDEKADKTNWAIAFPVAAGTKAGDGVEIKTTEAGKYAVAKHIGDYKKIGEVHNAIAMSILKSGISGIAMEEYVKHPGNEKKPENYHTKVYHQILKK